MSVAVRGVVDGPMWRVGVIGVLVALLISTSAAHAQETGTAESGPAQTQTVVTPTAPESPATSSSSGGDDVRPVAIGLVAVAVITLALSLFYWQHTGRRADERFYYLTAQRRPVPPPPPAAAAPNPIFSPAPGSSVWAAAGRAASPPPAPPNPDTYIDALFEYGQARRTSARDE